MQVGYEYEDRAANAPQFWNDLSIDAISREVIHPAIYAPYGTGGYWPNFPGPSNYQNSDIVTAAFGAPTNTSPVPMATLPDITTVTSLSGLSNGTPTAATPAEAVAGAPVGPISLVSPMPSITPPTSTQVSSAAPPPTCTVSNWISQNPGLTTLAVIGLFILFAGGKKSGGVQ